MSPAPLDLRPVVVTSHYPDARQPNSGAFVEALVRQWTRSGQDVAVIAPRAWASTHVGRVALRQEESSGPGEPTLLRPGFFSFSNRSLGPVHTAHWTMDSFRRTVLRTAEGLPWRPHLTYSHFLFPSGWAGLALARRLGVPAVAALGESGFERYDDAVDRARIEGSVRAFDGLLSVSQANRDWCVERYGADPDRIVVVPNATDTERFRPGDRRALRRELGLPEERLLLAFTGRFADRKGVGRVMEAIRSLPEIGGIFLGDGPDEPSGEQVMVARKVPNADVPKYLGASDLFVLPTLAEGSPNAIIEAMACGLPVVSSDIPALRETVDDENAILVDPRDTAALGRAIRTLAEDSERRQRMGSASRRLAERSSLSARAERIRDWLVGIVERGPVESAAA